MSCALMLLFQKIGGMGIAWELQQQQMAPTIMLIQAAKRIMMIIITIKSQSWKISLAVVTQTLLKMITITTTTTTVTSHRSTQKVQPCPKSTKSTSISLLRPLLKLKAMT